MWVRIMLLPWWVLVILVSVCIDALILVGLWTDIGGLASLGGKALLAALVCGNLLGLWRVWSFRRRAQTERSDPDSAGEALHETRESGEAGPT